jgi:hypothetical protein
LLGGQEFVLEESDIMHDYDCYCVQVEDTELVVAFVSDKSSSFLVFSSRIYANNRVESAKVFDLGLFVLPCSPLLPLSTGYESGKHAPTRNAPVAIHNKNLYRNDVPTQDNYSPA